MNTKGYMVAAWDSVTETNKKYSGAALWKL